MIFLYWYLGICVVGYLFALVCYLFAGKPCINTVNGNKPKIWKRVLSHAITFITAPVWFTIIVVVWTVIIGIAYVAAIPYFSYASRKKQRVSEVIRILHLKFARNKDKHGNLPNKDFVRYIKNYINSLDLTGYSPEFTEAGSKDSSLFFVKGKVNEDLEEKFEFEDRGHEILIRIYFNDNFETEFVYPDTEEKLLS